MADEEVLRLKATVVPDEAIASLRALGKELGLTGKNIDLRAPQKQFGDFKQVMVSLSREVKQIVPGLSMVGFGTAGIGLAAVAAIRGMKDMADRMAQVRNAAKELGLSQREVKAFQEAAEKASIAPEALLSSLQTFAANALDIKKGFTNLRGELISLGAGDVVSAIMGSTTQLDALHAAFIKLKDLGEKNPQLARMLSGQLFGNADMWRMNWDEFLAAYARGVEVSTANEAAAIKFKDAVIEIKKEWERFIEKIGLAEMPFFSKGIKEAEQWLGYLNKIDQWLIDHGWHKEGGDLIGEAVTGALKKNEVLRQNITPPTEEQTYQHTIKEWWNRIFGPAKAGPTAQMGALTPGISAMRKLLMSTDIGGRSRFQKAIATGVDKYDDFLAWINSTEVPGQKPEQKSALQRLHELLKPDFESAIDQILTWKNIPDPFMPGRQAMRYYFPTERSGTDQIKEGTKAGVLAAFEEFSALHPESYGMGAAGGALQASLGGFRPFRGLAGARGAGGGNLRAGLGGFRPGPQGTPHPQSSEEVEKAIQEGAKVAGMDVNAFRAFAAIESANNPNSNANRPTQYKGLFQIGRAEWQRTGQGGNIYSARDNALAAARLMKENAAGFRKHFGRDPTDAELYLMHQQGLGFYTRGTMTNIAGNPYPGMRGPQTHESFEAGWTRELERRKAQEAAAHRRMDQQIGTGGGNVTATGTVNVNVHAPKGTRVSESHDGLWQESTVRNYRQMQPTENVGRGFGIEGNW